jgi:hypothetical protein
MKIFFIFTTLALVFLPGFADYNYTGPLDERMPQYRTIGHGTLGYFARHADAVGVMDVIEVGEPHPDAFDYLTALEHNGFCPDDAFSYAKVRVVNALYGCTNGQELVIWKDYPLPTDRQISQHDLDLEYFPTNHSRIVCVVIGVNPIRITAEYTPKVWKQTPEPIPIITQENKPEFWFEPRCWWYDGYQDNLPLVHLTNLLHSAQVERNWTNYYHKVRDAIPTPASPRVWSDSFSDMSELLHNATQAQFDYIINDPLFPAECLDRRQDIHTRGERKREDE